MKLVSTTDVTDWETASNMLLATVKRLESIQPLWDMDDVTVSGLKEVYKIDELHFLLNDVTGVGSVFLQEADPIFWPECKLKDTLFFHKLNILPEYTGKGLGKAAVNAICQEAVRRLKKWVRLDCEDRPALHNFYRELGFSLVNIQKVGRYTVGRYQLRTS